MESACERFHPVFSIVRANFGARHGKRAPQSRHAVARFGLAPLTSMWRRLHRAPPPMRLSRDLLMRGITYKHQERPLGGLSKSIIRKLHAHARHARPLVLHGHTDRLGSFISLIPIKGLGSEHCDHTFGDFPVVGSQLLDMPMESVGNTDAARFVQPPEEVIRGHVEGVSKPPEIVERWLTVVVLEVRNRGRLHASPFRQLAVMSLLMS
jgi:hypothetical protein